MARVRAELLSSLGGSGGEADPRRFAMMLGYLTREALHERKRYSLLAMGHSEGSGCYCSVHQLLRESIQDLARQFDTVLIDAEAGIEQVCRWVACRVNVPIIVTVEA